MEDLFGRFASEREEHKESDQIDSRIEQLREENDWARDIIEENEKKTDKIISNSGVTRAMRDIRKKEE
jgi:cell shape-determining protein MreC